MRPAVHQHRPGQKGNIVERTYHATPAPATAPALSGAEARHTRAPSQALTHMGIEPRRHGVSNPARALRKPGTVRRRRPTDHRAVFELPPVRRVSSR